MKTCRETSGCPSEDCDHVEAAEVSKERQRSADDGWGRSRPAIVAVETYQALKKKIGDARGS